MHGDVQNTRVLYPGNNETNFYKKMLISPTNGYMAQSLYYVFFLHSFIPKEFSEMKEKYLGKRLTLISPVFSGPARFTLVRVWNPSINAHAPDLQAKCALADTGGINS